MTDQETVTVDQAERILRADYWQDVRSVTENLREMIESRELETEEDADQWLHETVDGHSRVIYTYNAQQCLLYSDNDGAYGDEFGSEGMVEDGCIMWSRLAYAAFTADIRETIDVCEVFGSLEDEAEEAEQVHDLSKHVETFQAALPLSA